MGKEIFHELCPHCNDETNYTLDEIEENLNGYFIECKICKEVSKPCTLCTMYKDCDYKCAKNIKESIIEYSSEN